MKKEKTKCKDLVKEKKEKRACIQAAGSKCRGSSKEMRPQVSLRTSEGCAKEFVFESEAKPVCLMELEDLPQAWRPSPKQRARLSQRPWTAAEQHLANQSVRVALSEMIDFQAEHPGTVKSLWSDSIEPYIDFAFDASNMPNMRDRALSTAAERLKEIAKPYNTDSAGTCQESSNLLTFLILAHNLGARAPDDKKLAAMKKTLLRRTNEAIRDCGTFSELVGFDPEKYFSLARIGNGKIYEMLLDMVDFLDALSIPELVLPEEVKPFITRVWQALASYPKPAAKSFAKGAEDPLFFDLAYLMTHAGFVPTGYGRYELCVSDGPWVYEFLRANFYSVLETGELDLASEFVDLFRQYGCTEDNDRQTRDGARYLLDIYEKAGRSWIKHRESYEKKKLGSYDLMHKPWTAGAGLRRRIIEPIEPKSYGSYARRLLRD
jgi:hypothetical protein